MAPRQELFGRDLVARRTDVPDAHSGASLPGDDLPGDAHAVAGFELLGEEVGLVEHEGPDRAGGVREREHEVRVALAGQAPLLATHGEDALHGLARPPGPRPGSSVPRGAEQLEVT